MRASVLVLTAACVTGEDTDDVLDPTEDGIADHSDEAAPEAGAEAEELTVGDTFCPTGFAFDATNQLCLSSTEAVAPFPPSMIADCKKYVANRPDGSSSCETTVDGNATIRWARSLAIGARTRTLQASGCASGTTRDPRSGYCSDGVNVYGPFEKATVEYCKQLGGGPACETNRIAAGLAPARPSTTGDWAYIMPLDYGLRSDSYGAGHFGAARSNSAGTHSGIDFLAPVGTALHAPCASSDVQTGYDGGYGNWVQIVCRAPASLSGGRTLWASLLFAHLSSVNTSTGATVARGARIGAVGKTGNAGAGAIRPHVHFEITLHATQAAAHADAHGSADNTSTQAALDFETTLRSQCLTPNGVAAKTGPVRRGRRPDPYLVLVCAGQKPALQTPPPSLQALDPWSRHFSATGFDINAGR